MSSPVLPNAPVRDIDAGTGRRPEDSERAQQEPVAPDIVDLWGYDSFPASDPPANW